MADEVDVEKSAAVQEEPKKKGEGGAKASSAKSALKKKVKALQAERDKLQESGDRRVLGRFRKKIKRLKRMTKRAA